MNRGILHFPPSSSESMVNGSRAMAEMGLLRLFFLGLLISFSGAEISSKVGINYGQLGDNLPPPPRSAYLIRSHLKAGRVKIYDTNPDILRALTGTGLSVSLMLPNELIPAVASNQSLADAWVGSNLAPFYPGARIRYLLVGNEILSQADKSVWYGLVAAMRKVKAALRRHGLGKVKVGTTLAMDVLESSYPPSNGTFRPDIAVKVMRPMLQFLNRTKSFYFLDVYPYFPWSDDPKNIDLDYALFESRNITVTDPGTGLVYHNLFDQMVDANIFAMARLGFPDVRVWIAETGWPNGGDYDQIGANIYNAATYNRNVVKKLLAKPPVGTPARPGKVLPSFIFALYNENQKPGQGTERHFGLLYPNGTSIYEIELNGEVPKSGYRPLPKPTNNEPYKGKIWCVVAEKANMTAVGSAVSYACSQGNKTCDAIQPGKQCYRPNSLVRHASYAFSSYWSQFKKLGGSCSFNGLAVQTIKDPSYGSCKFPSVTL